MNQNMFQIYKNQINSRFKKYLYTLGVFIDIFKAFNTADHETLIFKLEKFGVRGNSLQWLRSQLSNSKKLNEYGNLNTTLNDITCGVPQGSILLPLLFLIYVNDLQHVSRTLEPIMFADDTNLFYSHQNVNILLSTASVELEKNQAMV